GAGVEDNDVGGSVGFGGGIAMGAKAMADRGGVGLGGATAEIADEESGHGKTGVILARASQTLSYRFSASKTKAR
ncbi:MAG: hypothetical protein WA020_14495, partial [Candidatus Acidiferrales bacterium]